MKDELTPLERGKLYFSGERVDRLPFGLLGIETGCAMYNISPRECLHNPNEAIRVQREIIREFGSDSVGFGPDLKGIGEALGTEIIYPEWGICYVKSPVLDDYKKLNELKEIDFIKNKRMPAIEEILVSFKEEYGKTHEVCNVVAGPLSTASAIRGTEMVLKDMKRNPENLHRLLEFTVEINLKWIKHMWNKCEATVSIADPVSSGSLIGQERFREFSKPYLENMCKEIEKITKQKPSLHICGKTKNFWNDFKDLGIAGFSLDNCEKLDDFKNAVGEYITIGGNVNPTEIICFGQKEEIEKAVMDCMKKGSDSPKGYIPGAGCQIPLGISKVNLGIYVENMKKYGKDAKIGECVI